MLITKTSSPENIEHESLAAHVELCAHRNEVFDKRLSELQSRQDKLDTAIATSKFLIIKAIGVAMAVLTGTVSLTVIILDRLH